MADEKNKDGSTRLANTFNFATGVTKFSLIALGVSFICATGFGAGAAAAPLLESATGFSGVSGAILKVAGEGAAEALVATAKGAANAAGWLQQTIGASELVPA